jgi:hypothetical protein
MADFIPALTVRPPWAWCFTAPVRKPKRIENRGREMTHRGPLWLHAGSRARWDRVGADSPLVQEAWLEATGIPRIPHATARDIGLHRNSDLIPFGAVTAMLEVAGCHHSDECMFPASQELPGVRSGCSPWAARGQWHIETELIRTLPEPVPCRGNLGLWRLPEDVERAVRAQLEAVS